MTPKARQLTNYVIEPVLQHLELHSTAAIQLLLGTMAVESNLGEYVHQVTGPACGVLQIEPRTLHHVLARTRQCYPDTYYRALAWAVPEARAGTWNTPALGLAPQLCWNLAWSVAVARLIYYLAPSALPAAEDIEGLAAYWKQFFNSPAGKGTVEKFIASYHRYVE